MWPLHKVGQSSEIAAIRLLLLRDFLPAAPGEVVSVLFGDCFQTCSRNQEKAFLRASLLEDRPRYSCLENFALWGLDAFPVEAFKKNTIFLYFTEKGILLEAKALLTEM